MCNKRILEFLLQKLAKINPELPIVAFLSAATVVVCVRDIERTFFLFVCCRNYLLPFFAITSEFIRSCSRSGRLRGHVGAQEPRVHREPLHHGQAQGEAAEEEGKEVEECQWLLLLSFKAEQRKGGNKIFFPCFYCFAGCWISLLLNLRL